MGLVEGMPQAEVRPNAVTSGAVLSALAAGAQWQRTLQMLQTMPEAAVMPDTICISSAVNACANALQWQHALRLLKKPPDFYSYSASINACARCQRWSHALALASFLSEQRQPPNGIMWGAIVGVMPRGQAELTTHLRRSWVPQPPPAVPLEDLQVASWLWRKRRERPVRRCWRRWQGSFKRGAMMGPSGGCPDWMPKLPVFCRSPWRPRAQESPAGCSCNTQRGGSRSATGPWLLLVLRCWVSVLKG